MVKFVGEKRLDFEGNSSLVCSLFSLSRFIIKRRPSIQTPLILHRYVIDKSCGTRTTETREFLLHKKRYSRDELNTHLIRMSAYGFGGQSATNGGVGDTLAKKLSRWEHHRSETRDAFESVEKASKQFQECCTSSSVSVEEKIRSRNIFKREFERFKDALEKLENCLTMGYVLVVAVLHSHLDFLVCLFVLLRVRVVRFILVVLASFLPLTRKRSRSLVFFFQSICEKQ